MKTYIALLRGINVSGHKKILMVDLRALLKKVGFQDVQTYIQSGNVVFQSAAKPKECQALIYKAILKKYGWEVPILIRTASEIKKTLDNCPFPQDKKEKSYFCLLQEIPSEVLIKECQQIAFPNEEFIITPNCVYLYSELGAAKAKLNINFFERKLKVRATARNYRTMNKLLELASLKS